MPFILSILILDHSCQGLCFKSKQSNKLNSEEILNIIVFVPKIRTQRMICILARVSERGEDLNPWSPLVPL